MDDATGKKTEASALADKGPTFIDRMSIDLLTVTGAAVAAAVDSATGLRLADQSRQAGGRVDPSHVGEMSG